MDQFIHLLDPHRNWTHQPNVPSQVPSHKGIRHRLYQTMSCGYIFILDVRESFLNWSAAAWRTAPGKPDWWSWFARNNATNPAAIVMKRFSLVRLYHHWDAAIHYGVHLAQYCDQTLFCNAISQRSPPLCSFALRLRNTKVPVWTNGSIGYPKMDISHWDAAIHHGIKLAQYCDQTRSCNAISRRSPPLCSFALRLKNTKVPVWTHESIGYPKMDISHWDAAIHYGVQLAQYCD